MSLERQRSYGHDFRLVAEYTPAPTESILSFTRESYSCRSCAKEYTRVNKSNTLERSLRVCQLLIVFSAATRDVVLES